jgi:hypothetical protein
MSPWFEDRRRRNDLVLFQNLWGGIPRSFSKVDIGPSVKLSPLRPYIAAAPAGEGFTRAWRGQVVVEGLPADLVVTGKEGFRNTAAGALGQFGHPFRGEDLLPPFEGAALLGQGDAFARVFPDEGSFEEAKAPVRRA